MTQLNYMEYTDAKREEQRKKHIANPGVPLWLKVVGVLFIIIAIKIGSSLIMDALAYAGFGIFSLMVTWYNANPKLRLFTINHPIVSDTIVGVVSFITMGTGVTAMIGAMIVGMWFNYFFEFQEKYRRSNIELQVAAHNELQAQKQTKA